QVEGEQQYAIWQVRGFKQFSGTLSGQAIEDFMGELPKIDQSRPVLIEQARRIEDIATVHISSPMLEYVVSIAKYVERQGRSAFIVMPPGVWFWQMQMELSAKLRLRCGPARMLDFGDPARFETLYRRELFADNAHLNTEGAAVWSSLVAERFAEI